MTQKLVKVAEIRRLLNLVSDSRVYYLARCAILPGVVRIGRQVRFDLDKVQEFVDRGGQSLPGGWRLTDDAGRPGDLTFEPQMPSPTDPDLSVLKDAWDEGQV